MNRQTQEVEYRPPLRHDSPNIAFRNLLVEVYQEREAILQRGPALIPAPQADADAGRRPLDAPADERRDQLETVLRDATNRAGPAEHRLREPQRAQRRSLSPSGDITGADMARDRMPGARDHADLPRQIGTLAKSGAIS